MNTLLLHICCGPCASGVLPELIDFSLTGFFYNPNIFPESEHLKRVEGARQICHDLKVPLKEVDAKPSFKDLVGQNIEKPKRCLACYRIRLEKAALYAAQNNFDYFTTTLLISPYQYHQEIKEIGEKLAGEYQVNFYYQDFRQQFQKSQALAKKFNLYRQKYCGCSYSRKRK